MRLGKNSLENVVCVSFFELLRTYDMLNRAFGYPHFGSNKDKIIGLCDILTDFAAKYALSTHSVFLQDISIHKVVTGHISPSFYIPSSEDANFIRDKRIMYEWRHRKTTVIHSFVPYFLSVGIHKRPEAFIKELAASIDCNHDVPQELKEQLARIWMGATLMQADMIFNIMGETPDLPYRFLMKKFYEHIKKVTPKYDDEDVKNIDLSLPKGAIVQDGLRALNDNVSPNRVIFYLGVRKIINHPQDSPFYLYVYLSHGVGRAEQNELVPKGLEMYKNCAGKLFDLSTNTENIQVNIPIHENARSTLETEGSICFVVFCSIPGRPGRFEWEGFGRIPYAHILRGMGGLTHIQSGPFNSTISFDESNGEFKLSANNLMQVLARNGQIDRNLKFSLPNVPEDLCGNAEHKETCYDYIINRRNKLLAEYKETAKTVTFAYLYPIFPSQVLCSFAVTMMESPPYPVDKLCTLIDMAVAAHYSDPATFVSICNETGEISADEMEVIRAVVKLAFGFAGCLNYRSDKYVTGTPAEGGGIKISSDNAKNAWITGEGDCEDTAETMYHIIRYFCSLKDLSASASASASAIHTILNRDYIPGMATLYAHIGGQRTLHSMCLLMPSSSAHESKHPILLEGTSPRHIHVKTLGEVENFPRSACDKIMEVCGDSEENVSTWQYRPPVTSGPGCDGRYIGFIDFCAIVDNQPVDWYFESDGGNVIPSFDSVMNGKKGTVPFIEDSEDFKKVVDAHEYIRPFGHFPMPQFVESNNVPIDISKECTKIDAKCALFNESNTKTCNRKEGFCSSATMYFNWREFSIGKYDPVEHLNKLLDQDMVKNELCSVKHALVEMFPTIYVSVLTMIYREK